MNTYTKVALFALTMVVSAGVMSAAFAQTTATMPVLYNQNNQAVNTGSGYLAPGYYNLVNGNVTNQVYYYGNGTFYNPSTQMYGGSVTDSSGTAGVALNYHSSSPIYSGVMSTMPIFYNQNSAAVNNGGGYLAAGYYNLVQSPSFSTSQIYYYGNGVFYNPMTQMYGGSVSNPSGAAGVSLGYKA
jgi:hypothetical protein